MTSAYVHPRSGAVSSRNALARAITCAPAGRIVATAPLGPGKLGQRVGAVERIVQTAPASIGGVQRVAGVGDGHHQLRPGNLRNLRVHIGGRHGERRRLGQQIADLAQKRFVSSGVERASAVRNMPRVDLLLQRVAPVQQGPVARRQLGQQRGQPAPELRRGHAGAAHRLVGDEIVQHPGDLQTTSVDAFHPKTCPVACRRAVLPAGAFRRKPAPRFASGDGHVRHA